MVSRARAATPGPPPRFFAEELIISSAREGWGRIPGLPLRFFHELFEACPKRVTKAVSRFRHLANADRYRDGH
jgi:hypothetical protein